ncbi:MAG: copper amine oxidase N-terminal domain-containing protein, partial [Symbiobacteriaceae bacterium]|nr:copper amine oxidase N-terminal domain-containing protein [Symbiobacteriaceae bacterium]
EGPPSWLDDYTYRIWLNGTYLSPSAPPIVTEDGTMLIPLRLVLEADGITVDYDDDIRSVTVTGRSGETVSFNIDTGVVLGYDIFNYVINAGQVLMEPRFFELTGGFTLALDEYTRTILVTTDHGGYGDIIPYNLGIGELNDWSNKALPYVINGTMAVPDRENAPVVIITHGAHALKSAAETRYDIGLGYLMQELVQQGYAVFSLNVNMQFSFENGEPNEVVRSKQIVTHHLSYIMRANDGEYTGFPLSLFKRLDMQNVTLIGHSRNGQGIFWLAPVIEDLGAKVNGLLAHAPAVGIVLEDPYPDRPTAILVPSQDNDVLLMDGYRLYDDLHATQREADVHLVYLFGGNHNAFNEALLRQDNRLRNAEDPDKTVSIMDPVKQRNLYVTYILDFLEAVNQGGGLRELPQGTKGDFYGSKAMLSFTPGNREILPLDLHGSGGAVVKDVVGSFLFRDNTAGHMNFPGSPWRLPLYQISWEKEGASVELDLQDTLLSGFTALVIDLAQDSTSPLNLQQDQEMTVILRDKAGQTALAHLPQGTAALAWQEGEVVDYFNLQGEYWYSLYTNFTPLSSIVLPLSDFLGADLTDLQCLTLEFAKSSGCIVLRSVALAWMR